ncbi:glycosyltransferase [Winogradskyella wichelsiae]|uniref:glycosyltransferase n=1 Tax=Winogradskyella wichelsiae TaxID=2697007 RepID=UPI0015CAD15A|nr:glycosyltransferase [Winogradskyella wichelsiae]
MKILHITNSIKGGAGIAAYRLYKAQSQNNLNVALLSLNCSFDFNGLEYSNSFFKYKKASLLKKIKKKIWPSNLDKLSAEYSNLSKIIEAEITTLPYCNFNILEHPLVKEADIINLHWIDGIIDSDSFFLNIEKPILWTLHDMNPFMGIFHYRNDEIRNSPNTLIFNNKILNHKALIYKDTSIAAIVSPSKWLLDEVKKSKRFLNASFNTIYNTIPIEPFKFMDKEEIRFDLGLATGKIIFLFVSQNTLVFRKGFDRIINLVKDMKGEKECQFLAIGKPPENKIKGITYLGEINNKNQLANFYCAADAFLLPSREDNLPNTMLESLMCGTPVIASDLGGMKEHIINGFNGYLVSEDSSFKEVVTRFIQNKTIFNSVEISNYASKIFSEEKVALAYTKIYSEL